MANRKKFRMSERERRARTFSDNFKKDKIRELELGRITSGELVKQYEISYTTLSRWIAKFGSMKKKKERVIVETESDTRELLKLRTKIAELERIVGQKQVQLDFKDRLIDIAEEMYGVDIKKKLTEKPSGTSGTTGKNTPSA